MSFDDIAIRVSGLGKCFHVYDSPRERLKQFLLPKTRPFSDKAPRRYFREFWALKDVSFEVKKGETIGIVGRNGSGKSTLLQLICGTLNPSTGSVQANGRIAALLELGSGFNPEFTGRENVYLNGALLGLSREEIDARFDDIAAFAGIGEFIEQPVKTYSSGMMVRLAFSVSVCVEPDILIVDEALAVGDAVFQFKCLERLKLLTQSGTTLLFVSHDIQMVKSFCSRAVYLRGGEVQAIGMADQIAEQYIMDTLDEQQRQLQADAKRVQPKPALGERDGIAFGTSQGSITRAEFLGSGLRQAVFAGGESAEILIEVTYEAALCNPHVSVIVQNQRMIELGGRAFAVTPLPGGGQTRTARLVCTLPVIFGTGQYYITLRLESRHSQTSQLPVDKQVGVLSFEVSRAGHEFLGSVDIGLALEPAGERP